MSAGGVSRRTFLRLSAAAGLGVGLAGCTRLTSGGSDTTARNVQLVYQDWRTEWFPRMVQEMLAEFHEAHPNIRVFYTPDPESEVFDKKMTQDFIAGTAPDVFQGCCEFFPAWAQKGYCLDLRPFVEADLDRETIEDWDPAQYRAFFRRDGLQYGVPKYHGAMALYYNKNLFDENGVAYPDQSWDHEQYLAAMRRLSRDGDGQRDYWGSMVLLQWDRLQIYANAWGGHFVDPDDPTRAGFDTPQTMKAMEWLRERMWGEHVMATMQDVGRVGTAQAFGEGRLAMVEEGSWALRDILTRADFRVGVAPLPAGPVRRVTLATTDGFGIYAGTEHPEESWELVKFLISKQYGRAMARANFLQPARLSLLEDWAQAVKEEFPGKTSGIDLSVFASGQRAGYSVTAEVFPQLMAESVRIATPVFERIFLTGEGSVDELREADREIESLQKEGRAD